MNQMPPHWSTSDRMRIVVQQIARALLQAMPAVLQQPAVAWDDVDERTRAGLEHIAESMLIRAGWLLDSRERRRSALALTNTEPTE